MKVFLLCLEIMLRGNSSPLAENLWRHIFSGAHVLGADCPWRQIFSGANNLGAHVLGADILRGGCSWGTYFLHRPKDQLFSFIEQLLNF